MPPCAASRFSGRRALVLVRRFSTACTRSSGYPLRSGLSFTAVNSSQAYGALKAGPSTRYPLRVLKNIKVELVPYDVPLENVTEKFIR